MTQIDLENNALLKRIATALEVQNAIAKKQVKTTIVMSLLSAEGTHTYKWIIDKANEIHARL